MNPRTLIGDGTIQLLDALIVINELDRRNDNMPLKAKPFPIGLRVLDDVLSEEDDDPDQWVDDARLTFDLIAGC